MLDNPELMAWKWPKRPTTDAEFDEMMTSLDLHLAHFKLEPAKRGINAAIVISSALNLSGTDIFGSRHRSEPFSATDLLARVHEWYSANYGDRMLIDWSPGSFVLFFKGDLWRVKLPYTLGKVVIFVNRNLALGEPQPIVPKKGSPSYNILQSFEGMTQNYASKLTDPELKLTLQAFVLGMESVASLNGLRGSHLFHEARADYHHSVDALAGGKAYGKARWESAQCAEKIMKGLLARAGHDYPRSGARGHDLTYLDTLLQEKLGIKLEAQHLESLKCTADVRYGDLPSSREDALKAHEALRGVLRALDASEARFWQPPA